MSLRSACASALSLVVLATLSAAAPSLPGGLTSGPAAVGFRIADMPGTSGSVRVHVWYPASNSDGPALTIGDYFGVSPVQGNTTAPFADGYRQFLPRMIGGPLTDAEWTSYQSYALTARRDAPAKRGIYPLLIGMLRPISVTVQAEFLASHGYVVAFVEPRVFDTPGAEGLAREGVIMNAHIADMKQAVAELRQNPTVDRSRLGTIGFSGSGLAQLALAMSDHDVDAVVQLESGWYGPAGTSSYQEVRSFDPAMLRAPYLFVYGQDQGKLQFDDIRKMDGAPRYLLRTLEPKMGHWDFAAEGSILRSILDSRAGERAGVLRAFATIYRYQLTFLDAFVKGDQASMTALSSVKPEPLDGAPFDLTIWPRAGGR